MSASLPVLEPAPAPKADAADAAPTPGHAPALVLDPRTYKRALSCVHCGLCLPACPTYTETGHEADSPRGRIQLMRGLADGLIDATPSVKEHLDLCLDCRACETACPSGVVYHELIEETRARFAENEKLTLQGRFMRWIFFNVFVHPTRLKLALLPARVLQRIGVYGLLRKAGLFKLLPSQLRKMEQMLPADGPLWPRAIPPEVALAEEPKARVGFFAGCIGSVMFEKVNLQAVHLLAACGAEIVTPRSQGCCGAIHHHNGAHHSAQDLARHNIDTFLPANGPELDFIATNIAGCGAMLREYDFLLRDDPAYRDRAKRFASKVRDISEVLVEVGLPEMKHPICATVTYHDACHLAHAQKVVAPPRALLAKVPGLKLVPLPESDMCCGAAGTYNLQHPQMATQLAERKLNNIAATGASVCVTGNVGCAMQIQSEGDARGRNVKVVHPVEILHAAVFGPH
ncbi:MAG: heterodisulfide reductase-related iron-sulfur binding cluster [Tepidisphaeraceae bacterium]